MRMYEMDEQTIGLNAGRIWDRLKDHTTLTKHQLCVKTGLSDDAFHAAVGWLARENKIQKNGEFYQLGVTNLNEPIGTNAGVVLRVLKELPYSVMPIQELSEMTEQELHQSIGWLAREGNLTEFFANPEVLTLDETEEKLIALQDENTHLQGELNHRNEIINDLSMQLTQRQTEFIHQTDVVDQLHVQLNSNSLLIKQTSEELNLSHSHIHQLTEDIQMMSQDLLHRNQIIQELTRQVTDYQNMLIERTDALDRLQSQINTLPQHPLSPTPTTEIHSRINQIQSLQKGDEQRIIQHMEGFPSETRLYSKTTPSLDLQSPDNLSGTDPQTLDQVHQHIDETLNLKKHTVHPNHSN